MIVTHEVNGCQVSYLTTRPQHLTFSPTLALPRTYSQTITGNTCSSVSAGSPT